MFVLGWRFVVLAAYAFWQGGFLFYTAEVVPIGTEVLGSAKDQGFITRRVTVKMNQIGAVAVVIFAIDLFVSRSPSRRRLYARAAIWAGLAVPLVILIILHSRLDEMLDPEYGEVLNSRQFHVLHRAYLWTSTAQWFLGVAFLALAIWTWHDADLAKT